MNLVRSVPAALLSLLLAGGAAFAAPVQAPELGASLTNPKVLGFLHTRGASYGLELNDLGRLLYRKPDIAGNTQALPLDEASSSRIVGLIAKDPAQADDMMAQALESYLQTRSANGTALDVRYFTKSADGKTLLTQLGRNMLMDILTAADGLEFRLPQEKGGPKAPQKTVGRMNALEAMAKAGVLALGAGGSLENAFGAGAAFDGSITQNTYGLESYDWNKKGDPLLIRKERESGAYVLSKSGPGSSAETDYLRVLVAGKTPVAIDRLAMNGSEAGADRQIYKEAGLDPALMQQHGAKVVRAVDNLIAVDVPVSQAAELGNALKADGVASRPARLFKMVGDAVRNGPSWPDPLYKTLPLDLGNMGSGDVKPENFESGNILKVAAMAAKGMDGTGSVVGIVDSGIDETHPDFAGRVATYIDFSNSGKKDTVGHGTHVAGSIGGSGAASGGLYKGMAPQTKYVILKVFGGEGSASEDTILAALKAVKTLPAELRPQVLNLSLGGPGDPDTDPLSAMANELMVKDNIVMVIAAGNSGPKNGTIGSPGNARYVMTVTGVNKQEKFPFFPSRGPVTDANGNTFEKPDITTVSGDVSTTSRLREYLRRAFSSNKVSSNQAADPQPTDPACFYAPGGVISTRSKDDSDTQCTLKDNPNYRYMTGTSMATPLAAGIAADITGYLKSKNTPYQASEVKALMMETADDLGEKPEVQGAGLVDGERIAKTLEQRVKLGLPVGNVAFSVAQRTGEWDQYLMKNEGGRFQKTPLGLLDTKTQHLIRSDAELDQMLSQVNTEYKAMSFMDRVMLRYHFWRGA